MQKKFYLSKDGSQVGPYPYEKVLELIQKGEHAWGDYLWDESIKDWKLIMEHDQFSTDYKKQMIGQTNLKKVNQKSVELNEKAWFTLKEGNNYGPFTKIELVQMLQEKSLFEHDFIWKEGFAAWKPIADVEEFKPSEIKKLRDSGIKDVEEVFFRRRHLRAKYGCSVIVHNNKSVFRGHSVEISSGGAGIYLETNNLQPGQNIFLHFKPGDGVPPFNALCTIVSRSTHYNEKNEPFYKYGVKFLNISANVREEIKSYTTHKAA